MRGNRPGSTVALRGDIDALAMEDLSDNPWKSEIAGRCHACGHDGHCTWLLGALYALAQKRDFPGTVLGIFQPAEETGGGAAAICRSGIFERYGVAEFDGNGNCLSIDRTDDRLASSRSRGKSGCFDLLIQCGRLQGSERHSEYGDDERDDPYVRSGRARADSPRTGKHRNGRSASLRLQSRIEA